MGNVLDNICRGNKKKYVSCHLSYENHAVYEIAWKNFVVDPGRLQMSI
jgi:hypothetical protein